MGREPSEETERAYERRPGPDAPDETNYGIGRSRPLTEEEKGRLAREQAEAIASGRARKGYIVLRTPLRRAIFIGGLLAIIVLGLIVGVLN